MHSCLLGCRKQRMGRKSVGCFPAHSSSMEKAAEWRAEAEQEQAGYVHGNSTSTDHDDQMVSMSSVHWKPAAHPHEPLNDDQPAKFPMPPLSMSMYMAQNQAPSNFKERPNRK